MKAIQVTIEYENFRPYSVTIMRDGKRRTYEPNLASARRAIRLIVAANVITNDRMIIERRMNNDQSPV